MHKFWRACAHCTRIAFHRSLINQSLYYLFFSPFIHIFKFHIRWMFTQEGLLVQWNIHIWGMKQWLTNSNKPFLCLIRCTTSKPNVATEQTSKTWDNLQHKIFIKLKFHLNLFRYILKSENFTIYILIESRYLVICASMMYISSSCAVSAFHPK